MDGGVFIRHQILSPVQLKIWPPIHCSELASLIVCKGPIIGLWKWEVDRQGRISLSIMDRWSSMQDKKLIIWLGSPVRTSCLRQVCKVFFLHSLLSSSTSVQPTYWSHKQAHLLGSFRGLAKGRTWYVVLRYPLEPVNRCENMRMHEK